MKLKAGLMKNINKVDKALSRLIRKGKKLHINNINNEGSNITTDSMCIKRIIRECYPFNSFPVNLTTS